MIIKLKNNKTGINYSIEKISDFIQSEINSVIILNKIKVIIEEILMNIINYAYLDNLEHEITVLTEITGSFINITIIDDGRPFNPFEAGEKKASGTIETIPIGGLGITLIKKLTDSFSYQRENNYNIVKITKKINLANIKIKGR